MMPYAGLISKEKVCVYLWSLVHITFMICNYNRGRSESAVAAVAVHYEKGVNESPCADLQLPIA